jgi:hypothetical protein
MSDCSIIMFGQRIVWFFFHPTTYFVSFPIFLVAGLVVAYLTRRFWASLLLSFSAPHAVSWISFVLYGIVRSGDVSAASFFLAMPVGFALCTIFSFVAFYSERPILIASLVSVILLIVHFISFVFLGTFIWGDPRPIEWC